MNASEVSTAPKLPGSQVFDNNHTPFKILYERPTVKLGQNAEMSKQKAANDVFREQFERRIRDTEWASLESKEVYMKSKGGQEFICPPNIDTLKAAITFSKQVQPPTQDKVLEHRGQNCNSVNRISAKKLYNQNYSSYKDQYSQSRMKMIESAAARLDDGDIVKKALLLKEELMSNQRETLEVKYMYSTENGIPTGDAIGLYLADMNAKEDQWKLYFEGNIEKLNVNSDDKQNDAKEENIAYRGSPSSRTRNFSSFPIPNGELKRLVLNNIDASVEARRQYYRGATTFGNRMHSLGLGVKDGLASAFSATKIVRAYRQNDLQEIYETSKAGTRAVAEAVPDLAMSTATGIITGGAVGGAKAFGSGAMNAAGFKKFDGLAGAITPKSSTTPANSSKDASATLVNESAETEASVKLKQE